MTAVLNPSKSNGRGSSDGHRREPGLELTDVRSNDDRARPTAWRRRRCHEYQYSPPCHSLNRLPLIRVERRQPVAARTFVISPVPRRSPVLTLPWRFQHGLREDDLADYTGPRRRLLSWRQKYLPLSMDRARGKSPRSRNGTESPWVHRRATIVRDARSHSADRPITGHRASWPWRKSNRTARAARPFICRQADPNAVPRRAASTGGPARPVNRPTEPHERSGRDPK